MTVTRHHPTTYSEQVMTAKIPDSHTANYRTNDYAPKEPVVWTPDQDRMPSWQKDLLRHSTPVKNNNQHSENVMTTVQSSATSGVESLGSDRFAMDGSTLDLQTLIMTLQAERANNLEAQLAAQGNEIKQTTARLREARDMMAQMQDCKNSQKHAPAELVDYCKKIGLELHKDNSKEAWDTNITRLKAYEDELNSQSQLDMIRMQGLMQKRDQAFQLMTNTIQKLGKTLDGIIANMR